LRRLWWDEIASRNLPWYAEHKLDAGAAAAMVGLAILPDATWRAIAVGDSCLFHIRAGELIRAFPLSRSDEFDNRPELIESRPPATESEPRQISGELQAGDQLLMMTDAVARWFLSEAEVHHIPSPVIQRLFDLHDSPDQQAAEINQLRTSHVLRNDDVALQLIEF
jgi:hypothetical protein